MDPVVIAAAARTPIGAFLGELAPLTAPQLGAVAIRAAVERAGLAPAQIDELLFGNVLQAGLGQAPARQAALAAGLPASAACTTVHKVCGSGLKAVMLAHDGLLAGSFAIGVAGGMESMSNAPYLLPRARAGLRLGHAELLDHLFFDGLEDAYNRGAEGRSRLMGTFAEDCAEACGFSRAEQDDYALRSTTRVQAAAREGAFAWELAPVALPAGTVDRDEPPQKARPERISSLKAAFRAGGTVTAANSSSIADGAAAVVLMRASTAAALGIAPLARIVGHASHAQAPALFPTAPVGAITKLLARLGWKAADVDCWEINEAFAVVALAAIRELGLPVERVNVHGGACALGHPIGASGCRILVTLLGALRRAGDRSGRRGIASLCIGGGEAVALAVETCA